MSQALPQKLDELDHLLSEIDGGWLVRLVTRHVIDKIGYERLTEKLTEVAEAAVDDHFTSVVSERTLEPYFKSMVGEWVSDTMTTLDRFAR